MSTLRARLLLLVLLIAAPAFGLVVYNSFEQRELARLEARQHALSAAWAVANGVQAHVDDGLALLAGLATGPEAQRLGDPASNAACAALLARLLKLDLDYSDIALSDLQGDVLCSARPLAKPVNLSDREYFRQAVALRRPVSGGYHVSRISGRHAIVLARPILDPGGTAQGVASLGIDLAFAAGLLGGIPLPPGSVLSVVDIEGRTVIRKPHAPGLLGIPVPGWDQLRDMADRTPEPVLVSDAWQDRKPRLTAIVPVQAAPGIPAFYVRVGLPLELLYAASDRHLVFNLGLLSVALVFVLLLGWSYSERLLLRPMKALTDAARRLGAGDLQARAGVALDGEIGALGQAFDRMADELAQRDQSLQHSEALLRRSNRTLRLLDRVHRLMEQAQEECQVPARVCHALVESGNFLSAYILYAADEGLEKARLVAHAGPAGAIPAGTRWDEAALTREPAGVTLRTGRTTIHAAASTSAAPQHRAQPLSVIALPLRSTGRLLGVLGITSADPEAFDREEVALLEEAAVRVAFGIKALQARREGALAKQALLDSEHKLQQIMSSIDNLVWSSDPRTQDLLYANAATQAVLGLDAQALDQGTCRILPMVHPEDRDWVERLAEMAEKVDHFQRELRVLRPDGQLRWLDTRIRVVRDQDGRPARLDAVAADITARKEYEARLQHLTTYDALTGLPNQALLLDRLEQALLHAPGGSCVALLVLDMDRLSKVSESFGHAVRNDLLVEVAQRLRDACKGGCSVARLAGDEFAVLLPESRSTEQVAADAARIAASFERPFQVEEQTLRLTMSGGYAVFPSDARTAPELLQHAYSAMQQAKAEGGDRITSYREGMSEQARRSLELEQALREALERNELELHYQPQVDLGSGRPIGVEALARWRHPALGFVSPAQFIPLAESTDLIVPLTRWALEEACRQMQEWLEQGLPLEQVAVNISPRLFWSGNILEMVQQVLRTSRLPARHLDLEVTESIAIHGIDDVVETLEALRALGVRISLDDFGTGYSSLSHLRRLPIDKIKLDQSFVRGPHASSAATTLVAEIIRLAHVLNLSVVAEGIETPEVARFLQSSHCDAGQGYFYSKPLPAAALARWIRHPGAA